jgi:hypothetical protein
MNIENVIHNENLTVKPIPQKILYCKTCKSTKTPAPIMQQSVGDTSYIKAQPGRFSLWRDTTTATPVLTLAQATSQGFESADQEIKALSVEGYIQEALTQAAA